MLSHFIVSAAMYTVVLAAATADSNVKHNHALFNGALPPPHLFGLHGYMPLSQAPQEAEGIKIYPDLANAAGTGPHADFSWILHGIPNYLAGDLNISKESLKQQHYRIVKVENAAGIQFDVIKSVEMTDPAEIDQKLLEISARNECASSR